MPFATNKGVRIHYEVFGDGPPLFLHVGAAAEWDLWKLAGYLDRLTEYRLIVIDPRGRGRSDRPETLAAHRMKNYVGDVITILDDLGISRTAFWGHSDGARVGFALAVAHPDRLKALVAVGGHDLPTEYKDRVAFAKYVRENGMGFLDDVYEKSFGKPLPLWYTKRRRRRDPRMFELEMLAWRPWINNWTTYPKIRVPTLIMAGKIEDATGLSEKMAKLMPDARCVILRGLKPGSSDAGLDHLGGLMRSDLSIRYAGPFLREHSR